MTALHLDIGTPTGGAFQIMLEPGDVEVGRSATCAVRLPYPAVSSRHLRLTHHDDSWRVTDLGSKNGTLLNGRPIGARQTVELADGATIQIFDVTITTRYGVQASDGFTLTESGTMLRRLLAESSAEQTGAYLQAADGTRVDVPDFAAELRPTESTPFLIDRRGHGFWITPVGVVTLDGSTLGPDGTSLDDGACIEVEDVVWTFRDPLEDLVEQLDDDEQQSVPTNGRQAAPARPLDTAFLAVGVSTVVLAIIGLLIVFELV